MIVVIVTLKIADVCSSCGTTVNPGSRAVEFSDLCFCMKCARRIKDQLVRLLGPNKELS